MLIKIIALCISLLFTFIVFKLSIKEDIRLMEKYPSGNLGYGKKNLKNESKRMLSIKHTLVVIIGFIQFLTFFYIIDGGVELNTSVFMNHLLLAILIIVVSLILGIIMFICIFKMNKADLEKRLQKLHNEDYLSNWGNSGYYIYAFLMFMIYLPASTFAIIFIKILR